MNGVLGIVERCVPEGSETVAGQTVDRPAMAERLVHQRCEHALHQPGKGRGVFAERRGKRGKAANAAREVGNGAALSAELEELGLARQAVNDGERKGVRERAAQGEPRTGNLEGARGRSCRKDESKTEPGSQRIEEDMIGRIEITEDIAAPPHAGRGS